MEQETKSRPWHGLLGVAAALSLLLTVALTGDRARAAGAGAALDLSQPEAVAAAAVQVGDQVIPLGRAVGIKLFSDGVLVVGLSSLDTPEGPASPGKTSGL